MRAFAVSHLAGRGVTLDFIGGGSERGRLRALADQLGVSDHVRFEGALPAEQLAPKLQACIAAVATLKPGSGYEFAFPTKLYSATAAGAPLIHVGSGPAVQYVQQIVDGEPLGETVDYTIQSVSSAMCRAFDAYCREGLRSQRRQRVQEFARDTIDIRTVSARAANVLKRHLKKR